MGYKDQFFQQFPFSPKSYPASTNRQLEGCVCAQAIKIPGLYIWNHQLATKRCCLKINQFFSLERQFANRKKNCIKSSCDLAKSTKEPSIQEFKITMNTGEAEERNAAR